MTSPNEAESQLARNIENHLAAKGVTRKTLFDQAGISRNTFERNMANPGKFTVFQLRRIASALDVSLTEILPGEVPMMAAAA
ncbi:helix-turn-helix domain-containing protein [Arthrobacter sp. MA-N2]|uniref:helix-turn-helix domain-containing protein n=1 Tax=Arthrobacter sp. MA-N2 TaxID=1101188 RepID=UPI0004871A26|nr:helix-turn-helix domain-containing protein [Arthrobacter sp. MA-N2]